MVDDCTDLTDLVKFLLESKGWAVDTVFDGLKAIKALELKKYDIIILDLQMPNMDGFSFLNALTDQQKMHIPVLVYTSHDDKQTEQRLLDSGVRNVVNKPLSIEMLNKEIEKTLAI